MRVQYLEKLSGQQIVLVQRNTHDMWGDGASLEGRLEKLHHLMNFAGPLVSMCGLVDGHGEVVSSMKMYSLMLVFEKRTIATLGLGAVFTMDKHRRGGLAQQLIETVLAEARRNNYDAALLFSDIGPHYYQRFGFVELPSLTMSILTNDISAPPKGWQYRRAARHDITQLIANYDRIFPDHCLHSKRDASVWAFVRQRYGLVEDYLVSFNDNDCGYFSISVRDGKFLLHEFYVPPSGEEALLGLLKLLAEQHGITRIEGSHSFQDLKFLPKLTQKPELAIPMILSLDAKLPKEMHAWFGSLDQF